MIAERARAVLDLRATNIAEMRRLERSPPRVETHNCRRANRSTRRLLSLATRTQNERRTYSKRAKSLAAQMKLSFGECAAGGGSDGNLTAALGIPTLDGLGAVGDGAHSTHEHILTKAMPQRAALLAALLATV